MTDSPAIPAAIPAARPATAAPLAIDDAVLRRAPHPVPDAALARGHWTPAKQRIFLAALLDGGSVAGAARAAGMSRSSAHRLRERLAGTPFVRLWDRALAVHAQRLADPFAPDPFAPDRAPPRAPQPRS